MFDKEKLEKENEQFSSAILYVATAVYVAVCAMVFGALYAKLPSFGDAFLAMMKDYGTILAGIPVLVAVVVAKQQLDAMRRQHVAAVKLGLLDRITALGVGKKRMQMIVDLASSDQYITLVQSHNSRLLPTLDDNNLEYLKRHLPSPLFNLIVHTDRQVTDFKLVGGDDIPLSLDTIRLVMDVQKQFAKSAIEQLTKEESILAELWS